MIETSLVDADCAGCFVSGLGFREGGDSMEGVPERADGGSGAVSIYENEKTISH